MQDFFADAVREVARIGIRVEVGERQHGNGIFHDRRAIVNRTRLLIRRVPYLYQRHQDDGGCDSCQGTERAIVSPAQCDCRNLASLCSCAPEDATAAYVEQPAEQEDNGKQNGRRDEEVAQSRVRDVPGGEEH